MTFSKTYILTHTRGLDAHKNGNGNLYFMMEIFCLFVRGLSLSLLYLYNISESSLWFRWANKRRDFDAIKHAWAKNNKKKDLNFIGWRCRWALYICFASQVDYLIMQGKGLNRFSWGYLFCLFLGILVRRVYKSGKV